MCYKYYRLLTWRLEDKDSAASSSPASKSRYDSIVEDDVSFHSDEPVSVHIPDVRNRSVFTSRVLGTGQCSHPGS